jgi:hypothetical protein
MTFEGRIVDILPNEGLNNGADALKIGDRECSDCLNVFFRKKSVRKRDGTQRYIASQVSGANAVTGVAQIVLSTGAVGQLAFASNDVARENAGAWTSSKGAVTITASVDSLWSFAQMGDLLLASNNVNPLIKWTGAGNVAALGVTPSGPEAAKALVRYKNYILALNVSHGGVRTPERIDWSDLNAAETWPTANTNTPVNKAGQQGQGFGLIGDQLFAFYDRSIQQVVYTGDAVAPFDFPTSTPQIGACSGYAIVSVDWSIFFANEKGIYFFDGSQPQYISEKIEGTWKKLNLVRLPYIVGCHNKRYNQVWFSIATGSSIQNDTTLVYDYVAKQWTQYSGFAPNCYGNFFSVPAPSIPLDPVLGSYSGYVMKANSATYADDGTAVNAYALGKPLDFGNPGRETRVWKIGFVTDSDPTPEASMTVTTSYDLAPVSNQIIDSIESTGDTWEPDAGTSLFDVSTFATEGLIQTYVRPKGKGQYFQLQVGNNILNQGLNVIEANAYIVGEDAGAQA